jgi:hypothetical protein
VGGKGRTNAPRVDHDLVRLIAGLAHGGAETGVGTDDA